MVSLSSSVAVTGAPTLVPEAAFSLTERVAVSDENDGARFDCSPSAVVLNETVEERSLGKAMFGPISAT